MTKASAAAAPGARRSSLAQVRVGGVSAHKPTGSGRQKGLRASVEAAREQRGLLLFVGERREGDMEWHAGAWQVPARCVDKRQPAPCDVEAPGVAAAIIAECRYMQYSYMHSSFTCSSWSRQVDAHMRLTLVCGKLIHDAGGSVTVESTPGRHDPASAQVGPTGDYDAAAEHPFWEDALVKAYIAYTGSELVTRPMCSAGSPHRVFRTVCINRKALAGSEEYRALKCTHLSHPPTHGGETSGV